MLFEILRNTYRIQLYVEKKPQNIKQFYENHLIDDYRKSSKLREIKYKMQLTSLHKSFLLIEIVVYSSSKKTSPTVHNQMKLTVC